MENFMLNLNPKESMQYTNTSNIACILQFLADIKVNTQKNGLMRIRGDLNTHTQYLS